MKSASTIVRGSALAIALIALAGLGINFAVLFAANRSAIATVWILLRYFTITTNLLVAGVFIVFALSGSARIAPKLMGATVLSIVLVGVVFALLLSGQLELSGGSRLADVLLHRITPVAVPLFWLCLVPKGLVTRRDPLRWALYPACYFFYALGRGLADGNYAYPFMNPVLLGWPHTALNAVGIGIGFLIAGELFRWVDHRLRVSKPECGQRA